MNLYLLTQTTFRGYDTYNSCVVAALDEETARNTHPGGYVNDRIPSRTWPAPEFVTVTLIGTADPSVRPGVVCSSFNAG